MFGHEIDLNFDKKGEKHNTLIGGFFSIIIYIGLGFYMYKNIVKLIEISDNDETTTIYGIDL